MISDELYSHLADRATTRQCHAVRPGTASNQRTALKLFIGFCTKFRINYRTVSEDNVCVFLEYLAGIMRSPSTVSNYLGSLRTCFRKMRYDTTPFTHHKVKDALNALSVNIRHVPRGAVSISPGELSRIVTYLNHDQHGPSLVLAVVLMYMTLMRQSSVSPRTAASFDPSRHLCRQDVQTHASGLTVNHKWAKCEQQASSYDSVNLPRIQGSLLCPVRAYRRMLHVAPTLHSQQALVAFKDGTPLPLSYLGSRWKAAVSAAKLSDRGYTLHGLRKGGATFIQEQTTSDQCVATYGRWKSSAVQRYIKNTANIKASRAFQTLKRK